MSKKLWVVVALMCVGVYSTACSTTPENHKGWISGLIPDGKEGAELVAVNLETKEVDKVVALPDVNPNLGEYGGGALCADGSKAAYLQQENEKMKLVVSEINGASKTTEYFGDIIGEKVYGIEWLPDSRRLLCLHSVKEVFPREEICMVDTQTHSVVSIVQGGIWNAGNYVENEQNPDGIWTNYMSQQGLNQLIEKYGGITDFKVNEDIDMLFIKFSSPSISPDGKKIAFSASLNRNRAPEGESLWLASGIWTLDIDGGDPKLIYRCPDKNSTIGKVTWLQDGKRVAFYTYSGLNGTNGKLEALNVETRAVQAIVPNSTEHNAALNAIPTEDDKLLFVSVPSNGEEKRYEVDLKTGEMKPWEITINGEDQLLWGFSRIK